MAADATAFLPEQTSLEALREAASHCHGCDLWRAATQTVFGEGPEDAGMFFVGEAPGDREDREGRPSAILRGRDSESRQAQRELFTEDLRVAADALAQSAG